MFYHEVLAPDYLLVNLDVVSLISYLYLDRGSNVIDEKRFRIPNHCSIPKDKFSKINSSLFDNNYVKFNNNFYKQTFNIPLVAKLSFLLANFVMDD